MGSSGIQEDFEPYHELKDGLLCIMAIFLQTEMKLRYFYHHNFHFFIQNYNSVKSIKYNSSKKL